MCSIARRNGAVRVRSPRAALTRYQHLFLAPIFIVLMVHLAQSKMGKTSIKNHFKGDIGMANYEKQVEQEAAYPIPISLYNCYRTVRQEKRGIAIYS